MAASIAEDVSNAVRTGNCTPTAEGYRGHFVLVRSRNAFGDLRDSGQTIGLDTRPKSAAVYAADKEAAGAAGPGIQSRAPHR